MGATSFVKAALKYKKKSRHNQHKLVALIIKGGNILSVGWNMVTTHAEKAAIEHAWRQGDLANTSMFVIRFRKSGTLGMALPCKNCQLAIQAAGIKKVSYS